MKLSISAILIPLVLAPGLLPAHAQQSEFAAAEVLPSQQLLAQAVDAETIAQEFVALMVEGDYQAALQKYDLNLRADLSVATLEQSWQDVKLASGSFQEITDVVTRSLDSSDGSSLAIVTCQFEKGQRDFFVVLTSNSRIASISPAEG